MNLSYSSHSSCPMLGTQKLFNEYLKYHISSRQWGKDALWRICFWDDDHFIDLLITKAEPPKDSPDIFS